MNYVADSSDITESKSIPNNWETACLADFAIEFISGGTPSTKESDFWDGEIPWTTSAPISEQDVLLCKAQRFITQRGLKSSASNIVPKGNLIVGTRVGVGKAVTNTIDMAISQDLTGVVLNYEKVQPEYISYYFKTQAVQQFFNGRKRGTTIKGVSRSDLQSLVINLPPLPEQRAIARALRAVQAAREARLREIALERERKAALMEHLFTHGTRGEPTKMTEIGEMPESWEVVKFGKVIISSAFGPRFSSNYYDPDGSVATLRTTDLDNEGNINYSTMPLAKLELDGFKQHLLKSNDFLITRSGTCGIAAIFEAFEKPVLPGAFIIRFRLSNEINPLFLKYYVNSQQGRNRILQLAGGAVQKNLSGTSLRTFQIPLPLLVDQDAIVRSLIACDSKIAALDHEAHLHDKLFRAMLEELMTGRLRVGALATPSS